MNNTLGNSPFPSTKVTPSKASSFPSKKFADQVPAVKYGVKKIHLSPDDGLKATDDKVKTTASLPFIYAGNSSPSKGGGSPPSLSPLEKGKIAQKSEEETISPEIVKALISSSAPQSENRLGSGTFSMARLISFATATTAIPTENQSEESVDVGFTCLSSSKKKKKKGEEKQKRKRSQTQGSSSHSSPSCESSPFEMEIAPSLSGRSSPQSSEPSPKSSSKKAASHKITPRKFLSPRSIPFSPRSKEELLTTTKWPLTSPNSTPSPIAKKAPFHLLRSFCLSVPLYKELRIEDYSVTSLPIHSASRLFRSQKRDEFKKIFDKILEENGSFEELILQGVSPFSLKVNTSSNTKEIESDKIRVARLQRAVEMIGCYGPTAEEKELIEKPHFQKILYLLFLFKESSGTTLKGLEARENVKNLFLGAKRLFDILPTLDINDEESYQKFFLLYCLSTEISHFFSSDNEQSFIDLPNERPLQPLIVALCKKSSSLDRNNIAKLSEKAISVITALLKKEFLTKEEFADFCNFLRRIEEKGIDLFALKIQSKYLASIDALHRYTTAFALLLDLIRYFQTVEKIVQFLAIENSDIDLLYIVNDGEVLDRIRSVQFCWLLETLAALRTTLNRHSKIDFSQLYEDAALIYNYRELGNKYFETLRLEQLAEAIENWPREVEECYKNEAKAFISKMKKSPEKEREKVMPELQDGTLQTQEWWHNRWIFALFGKSIPEYRLIHGWAIESWNEIHYTLKTTFPEIFANSNQEKKNNLYATMDQGDGTGKTLLECRVEEGKPILSTSRQYTLFRPTKERGGVEMEGRNSFGDIPIGTVKVTIELSSSLENLQKESGTWERFYHFSDLSFNKECEKKEQEHIEKLLYFHREI